LEGVGASNNRTEAHNHLDDAKRLFERGNYELSIRENEKVLSLTGGQSPGDEALFNMGLITAHSKNPKKDYLKSLSYFERLIREYPESQLIEQSKVWVQVLQAHQRIVQEKMALAREKEKLNEALEQSRKVDIEIEKKRRKNVK
jgi:tetratricopeptide (TPR) repeat protein